MTANRRIFLNIIATYGRSLYALVIGLFTARWVLMALGEVDFGLYGVVGGLTFFVIFINELLAMSVARFFGVSVGAAKKEGNETAGVDDCRKWFNTALTLHTVVPIILVLIGYPCGEWAVRHFLTIPPERIEVCVWVWRFTCFACFVGMVTVPFRAMYTAKQEIAELTIYGFVSTTVTAVMLYYMASHPADWLYRYAFYTCLIAVVPNLIIAWRAVVIYPECRFVRAYLWSKMRALEIGKFAAARFFTSFSSILTSQGHQILVNKYLGPRFNAAMRVGNTVASQSATLAGSLNGAFWPAITNAVGEGDDEKVRRMSFQVCRMSTFLVMIFAVPLMLECKEVLRLWLCNPPAYAAEICCAVLIGMLIDRTTEGYWMAVMGFGTRISFYSWWISWGGFIGFFLTWVLFALNLGILAVCISVILYYLACMSFRLWLGNLLAGLSLRHWFYRVFAPLVIVCAIGFAPGACVVYAFEPSFIRVIVTTAVCEFMLVPAAWFFVLSIDERNLLVRKLNKILRR